jgi:DNA-binding transcriptional LysR family regulator
MDHMRNLDISLLRTLLQVAEADSMTVAARRLHMTQGAVSQRIMRLEQAVGQILLLRGKNANVLTAEGERLLPQARKLVELNDELIASMQTPEVSGAVRLGVPHDLMGTHLPPILQAFTGQYPLVTITLVAGSSAELKHAFETGAVQLALMEEVADAAGGETLAVERPVWAGKAGGNAWRQRPLPVCLVSATCVFRPPMVAALAAADMAWRNVIDYPDMEAVAATVQSDLAVTVLLPSTIPASLLVLDAAAGLPPLPPFAITMHTPARGANAACAALAQAIRAAYLTASAANSANACRSI